MTGRRRGFTLVEALVSMTILGVGIVGVMSAFTLASRSGSEAMRLSEAAAIADQRLETLLGSSESQWVPRGVSGNYAWEAKVADLRDGLRLATVVVRWTDRRGRQEFELSEVFLPRLSEGD